MASRSFGRAVTLRHEMEEAVAAYTARAAEKMRRQNLTTAYLQVFVHTNRFRLQDAQHFAAQAVQLPIATADTGKLTSAALRGVAAIWKQGYRYKKAGVIFLDLRPATEVQGTLFDKPDTPAKRRLMRTLDSLNAALQPRYGHLCGLRPAHLDVAQRSALGALYDPLLSVR